MGDGKKKKKRFLAANPWCCFCGGIAQAQTVDHIPARACFRDRHPPEGFEFPACSACNSASRLDEQVMALAVRLLDPAETLFDDAEIRRTVSAVQNNVADAIPEPILGAREVRAGLKELGMTIPFATATYQVPLMRLPAAITDAIIRYGEKLQCALYYHAFGRCAPADHFVMASWGQDIAPRFREAIEPMLPVATLVEGARPNMAFGGQFKYYRLTAGADASAFVSQFGTGLTICGFIADPEIADKWAAITKAAGRDSGWTRVADIYSDQRQKTLLPRQLSGRAPAA